MTGLRRLEIPDVIEIVPPRFGDERGFFSEVFKRETLATEGIAVDWIQDNHSLSATPGTVRGLHLQAPPHAQDKLIRVLRGAIFDVAVDIRRGSPTYGRCAVAELSRDAWNQLYIPAGFAHGFMTLTPDTEVLYKVSAPYAPACEMAIRWDDPDLAIPWPANAEPVLSAKDAAAPAFADFASPFTFEG